MTAKPKWRSTKAGPAWAYFALFLPLAKHERLHDNQHIVTKMNCIGSERKNWTEKNRTQFGYAGQKENEQDLDY